MTNHNAERKSAGWFRKDVGSLLLEQHKWSGGQKLGLHQEEAEI